MGRRDFRTNSPLAFSTRYAHDVSLALTLKNGEVLRLPARPDATRGGYVVNTAGVLPRGTLLETSEETIYAATEVNYLAPVFIAWSGLADTAKCVQGTTRPLGRRRCGIELGGLQHLMIEGVNLRGLRPGSRLR